jgi:hypothetical protein
MSMLHDAYASQPVVLALSDLIDREARDALQVELRAEYGELVSIVSFAERGLTYDLAERYPGYKQAWLCFVDSAGVLRVAERFFGYGQKLPDGMSHWLQVFREHRRGR